ncbi:MAG: NAD-dependent epimerase/dehydratase family protein, partial [Bacteroidota bacterium]
MILVTGANGLVGSYVCKALKKSNTPFRGLVREGSDLALVEDVLDNLIYGDFLDLEFMTKEIQKIDVVVHCAAIISFSNNQKEQMRKINVEGTKQLVNLALASHLDYFLYVSSVAAIGRSKKNNILDETKDWIYAKGNTLYGESKHLGELEVWRAMQEGLTASIVNPSVILGAGDWTKSSTKLFKYVWNENKYYGGGNLNYVDVRDVTSIILILIEKRMTHERFILSAGATSYQEFFRLVAREFGKKPPSRKFKKWQGIFAVMVSSLSAWIKGSKPLVTKETIQLASDM